MSEYLEILGAKFSESCIVKKCKRAGCSVKLSSIPIHSRLIVDLDCKELRFSKSKNRCDFLFFHKCKDKGPNFVVPLELKRGQPNIKLVVKQLQGGADIASKMIPKGCKVKFLAVLVHGGGLKKSENNELKKVSSQIMFQNKPYRMMLIRCNSPLKQMLDKLCS